MGSLFIKIKHEIKPGSKDRVLRIKIPIYKPNLELLDC